MDLASLRRATLRRESERDGRERVQPCIILAMRIGLTFDIQDHPASEAQAEFDRPETLAALTRALALHGHEVVPLGSARRLLDEPASARGVDLVFNIAEGAGMRCREAWAPVILEQLGVPYVGSGPLALAIGLDKVMCKRLALASGMRTPRWISVDQPTAHVDVSELRFPLIVKPRWEGSAMGIDAGAVVCNLESLHERLRAMADRLSQLLLWSEPRLRPQPLLVEEFIPFGELTVCVIGNDPPVAYPAIQRPIEPASRLGYHVVERGAHNALSWEAPVELTTELDAEARRLALVIFEAVGCRDMARVDFRVDAGGQLFFLEINPLPSFDPEGSIGLLAEYLGLRYADLIQQIVSAACRRLAGSPTGSPTP